MRIVRDLMVGSGPPPIEVHYNGTIDADSVTLRYKGSLVKVMDINDVDNGYFFTFGGSTTALENIAGILAEDQPITGNYLPNDTDYGITTRKMWPIFPSSVIRAEYARTDKAGTATLDTGATAAAGSTTFTAAATGTADYTIGGWLYFTNGANADYLHYIIDDDGSGAITLATATTGAVVATDDFIVVNPACTRGLDFNATYTGLLSEIDSDSWHLCVQGIMTHISAPGLPLQPLSRDVHDGRQIANARFYHDFVFTGGGDVAGSTPNLVWTRGIAAA
ncbi:MAG: hypothetical protein ACYS3N_15785 [Planctomycetota bacterium]|jgi:hypothetical protein